MTIEIGKNLSDLLSGAGAVTFLMFLLWIAMK